MTRLQTRVGVIEAINTKIEATQLAQQRENEVLEADALLLEAKAEAEANDMRMKSLSSLLLQYELIKRWNGAPPSVSSGAVPMLDIQTMLQGRRNPTP